MAATTRRSEPAPGRGQRSRGQAHRDDGATLQRFDGAERVIHWTNAVLFAVMIVTAGCLYFGPLSTLVGRRELVKNIHVYAGLLLPVPILAGLLVRGWGRAFRADVRRLNRFLPADGRWLRSLGRDRTALLGKFNPGQKLNAAFTAGAIVVMLASGSVMRWFAPFPLAWRTGATFVHDTLFVLLVLAISGHIIFATRDRESLGGMQEGWVSASWARRHHPRWVSELTGPGEGAEAGAGAIALGPPEAAAVPRARRPTD